ncbi:hypothetical protein NZD88_16545 [Chryseobacterium antibioticum]|uniref:Uncharacterized protein n=2 Tax=Chryseobacterium TaxID=59732 RepID=A0A7Y0FQT1_9FLAO|nr:MULTISPECIES: hypothetical protein [Chryseobacterium]MCT2409158.1 hypothetical protein [Chryseobacterium pyrolae]NML68699.1 hypothetical protein [Chryseobacterium antibioticum]
MASQNPVINQNGTASIKSGQFCTWNTANGTNATITIANSSRSNVLKFAISGAPASGIIVDDPSQPRSVFDGVYSLKPNSPNVVVTAFGDFGGSTVTITNITNAQNDAEATIQCQTS